MELVKHITRPLCKQGLIAVSDETTEGSSLVHHSPRLVDELAIDCLASLFFDTMRLVEAAESVEGDLAFKLFPNESSALKD